MYLEHSDKLGLIHTAEYKALLLETDGESFFYGKPLKKDVERMVVIHEADEVIEVVGFFEAGMIMYDGSSYYRTNRPYTGMKYRGKGYMLEALKQWYAHRRPAMSWIDDNNVSSIRLFQNVGFRKAKPFFHKGQYGHFYVLET